MKLSIVTPSHNAVRFLDRTARSILSQTGDFELQWVVVDGGSTDGTREIVERYPVQHFVSERDRGQADAINKDSMWGNYIAYSRICTHAGCPASLYEQQTNRLLCPCHQSQFMITDNARPIFGPASRRLPQLPIEVDAEGFFVAASDYKETIGPDFWERP